MAGSTVQYPDVLGALTGGARVNLGALQCALAARPAAVAAGNAFEVIVLVQNASDIVQDVTVGLQLPELDARKQKGRFISGGIKPILALKAGETGFFTLPVAALADTAPSTGYKLSVDISSKTVGKFQRVRSAEGGGLFDPKSLSSTAREAFDSVRTLNFVTGKALLRGTMELSFAVTASRPALPPELAPSWVSLWSLVDADYSYVLAHYAELLLTRVFPHLKRSVVYQPLLETTRSRFADAGYVLHDSEAILITKLMTLIVEYADPRRSHGYNAAGVYGVEPLVALARANPGSPVTPPEWMRHYLRMIARDERAADYAPHLLTRQLYLPLLRDAIQYGFSLVSQTTGQILGDAQDMLNYADDVIACLERSEGLNFQRVYLPLVMGGTLINDKLLLQGEQQDEQVGRLVAVLQERESLLDMHDADVLDLAQQTIHRVTKIYGHRGE